MSVLLDSLAQGFSAGAETVLATRRQAALDAALRDGLPHARSEAWKYTPLRALERRSFEVAGDAPSVPASALPPGLDGPRMVFVNGRISEALSTRDALPPGVHLQTLSKVLAADGLHGAAFLGQVFERADEPFARLNAALAGEGAVVRVDAGVNVAQPLHLVFVGTATDADAAWHLRHAITLGEGARLQLIEHHVGVGAHQHLANALMHVQLAAGAQLQHLRVQDEAGGATLFTRTEGTLAASSQYRRLDLELGAALSRHELNVQLHGDDARLHANGVLLATGRRHLDTRLGIDHLARDSACELTWRGLGAGRSRAVFHGGILIREGADGTRAELSNKNLLLSADAEVDTQPVLEIHADEVQAAHGATVGQLDPVAMFYLRSRGVPHAQARAMLTAAFCRATVQVLEQPALRDLAAAALDAALARLDTP